MKTTVRMRISPQVKIDDDMKNKDCKKNEEFPKNEKVKGGRGGGGTTLRYKEIEIYLITPKEIMKKLIRVLKKKKKHPLKPNHSSLGNHH